jgi:hypothetical protein
LYVNYSKYIPPIKSANKPLADLTPDVYLSSANNNYDFSLIKPQKISECFTNQSLKPVFKFNPEIPTTISFSVSGSTAFGLTNDNKIYYLTNFINSSNNNNNIIITDKIFFQYLNLTNPLFSGYWGDSVTKTLKQIYYDNTSKSLCAVDINNNLYFSNPIDISNIKNIIFKLIVNPISYNANKNTYLCIMSDYLLLLNNNIIYYKNNISVISNNNNVWYQISNIYNLIQIAFTINNTIFNIITLDDKNNIYYTNIKKEDIDNKINIISAVWNKITIPTSYGTITNVGIMGIYIYIQNSSGQLYKINISTFYTTINVSSINIIIEGPLVNNKYNDSYNSWKANPANYTTRKGKTTMNSFNILTIISEIIPASISI